MQSDHLAKENMIFKTCSGSLNEDVVLSLSMLLPYMDRVQALYMLHVGKVNYVTSRTLGYHQKVY